MTSSSMLPAPPPRPVMAGPTRSFRSWIWTGGALIALGVLSVVGWIIYGVIEIDRTVDDFVRAREGTATEFTLASSRDWTVYVEPQSTTMSGLRFTLLDADGERVGLRPYGGDLSYSVTGHSGRAIGTVSLVAGDHQLLVEGSGPRAVAIGPSVGGRIVRIIVGSLAMGIPLIGGGATVMIVGALRQSRARNRSLTAPPPSQWSAGEWDRAGPPS